MKPKIKCSCGRTKDWHASEAQAEMDIRNGQGPGAWRSEDRAGALDAETNGPQESGPAALSAKEAAESNRMPLDGSVSADEGEA